MAKLWKDYSLSIVLLALFLVAWTLQTWTGWVAFTADQHEHGQSAQWFGESGYVWQWAERTMENWQSEFLQLLTFVVLTAYLIHKGSHESKDTDDEMMAMLRRIESRIERLEAGARGTLPDPHLQNRQ